MRNLFCALSLLLAGSGLLIFNLPVSAEASQTISFNGLDMHGAPCSLQVLDWGYIGDGTPSFDNLWMLVATPWQKSGHAPLKVFASPTPYSLYGIDPATRDSIALDLNIGAIQPSGLRAFTFESHDGGLFQSRCLFSR